MPPRLCEDVGIEWSPPTRCNPRAMGARWQGCGCKPTPLPSAPQSAQAHGLRPHAGEEQVAALPNGSSCSLARQPGLEQPERVS